MLKSYTIAIIILIVNLHTSISQPWHYNFGTSSGSFSTNNGSSTTFLPLAPSGTSKVKVSSNGGGSFNMEMIPNIIGSDSYLRISAPTAGSLNKFSVFDYSPNKTFTLRFIVKFGANDGSASVSSGIWYLFVGDGACFSDATNFAGSQVFTGLRFSFGVTGAITTSYRNGGGWTLLAGTPFAQGQNYIVDIYGNNSTSTQNYTYGTSQTVAANKWDLWINGLNAGDDLSKALLANDIPIDSYMFYGESSTGNAANIFLDDIDYHNDVAGTPLPVTLTSFNVTGTQRNAMLTWCTSSEINNAGFDIERSSTTAAGITTWNKTAFIHGNGTTNEPKSYFYEDKNLSTGKYSYRLKQIDFNGNFEYFNPSGNSVIDITKPAEFTLSQNYPNPSNPVTKIDYHLPFDGFVNITVYDITGKVVKQIVNTSLTADFYTVTFDGSDLSSGIYIYRITGSSGNETFSKSMKMLLIK